MYFGMPGDSWLAWMEEINLEMELNRHTPKECKLYEIIYLSTMVDYAKAFPPEEVASWPWWFKTPKTEKTCMRFYRKHDKTQVFRDTIKDKISHEDNVIIHIAGDTGSGKSILGLSLANEFDPNMHKGRFGNSNRDVIENIATVKQETIIGPKFILRDEILPERGADSHVAEDVKEGTMVALRKSRISEIECCPEMELDEKYAFSLRMIDNNYYHRSFPNTAMTIEQQVDWYLEYPAVMRALIYKSPKGGRFRGAMHNYDPWGFIAVRQLGWRMDARGNMSIVEKERKLLIDYTQFKEEQNEKIASRGIADKDFVPFFKEILHTAFSSEDRIQKDALEMFQSKAEEGDVILTRINMTGAGDVIYKYARKHKRWHGITEDMQRIMARRLKTYCLEIDLFNVPLSDFLNDPDHIKEFTSKEVEGDE